MNKSEQAVLENLRTELAFRRTEPCSPDLPVPTGDVVTKGWLFVGVGCSAPRVEKACSSSIYHGLGTHTELRTQKGCALYSTEALALKGMRHAVEAECMHRLRSIDKQIEQAEIRAQTWTVPPAAK